MKITSEQLRQAGACQSAIKLVELAGGIIDTEKLIGKHEYLNWLNARTFDEAGRLVKIEYSDGGWEKNTYDEAGRLVKVENSDGWWKKNTYNEAGRLVKVEGSDGWWKKNTYNEAGRLVKVEDCYGGWIIIRDIDKAD